MSVERQTDVSAYIWKGVAVLSLCLSTDDLLSSLHLPTSMLTKETTYDHRVEYYPN
jgi:hypothetical protein